MLPVIETRDSNFTFPQMERNFDPGWILPRVSLILDFSGLDNEIWDFWSGKTDQIWDLSWCCSHLRIYQICEYIICEYINIYLSIFLLMDIWLVTAGATLNKNPRVFVWADMLLLNLRKRNNRSELISKWSTLKLESHKKTVHLL